MSIGLGFGFVWNMVGPCGCDFDFLVLLVVFGYAFLGEKLCVFNEFVGFCSGVFCYLVYCVPCLIFEDGKDFFSRQGYLEV